MARLALFGGSFNPPHVGHQMVMLYALSRARVDRLLMVPCFVHPFEKQLVSFEHRLAMCRLAAAPLAAHVDVSDVEARLGGESRTLRTVQALRAECPHDDIVLVIGSDLVAERERWFGWPELTTLVEFFIVPRAGHDASAGEVILPDVSSHEVRSRLGGGGDAGGWLPSSVTAYVREHGLYR